MRCAPWVGLLMTALPWTPVGAAPAGAQVAAQRVGGVVEDGRGVACGSAFDGERAPARDLYCIELLARPGIRGASGVVELSPLPLFGWRYADELGSIEPGKIADMVLLQGDLIDDPSIIRNTVIVFKDGVGYEAPTLLGEVRGRVGIN